MNRRRNRNKAGFPRNLYENKGYFSWRNPITGDEFGFGRDRMQAFAAALECNLRISRQLGRPNLVEKVFADRKRSVAAWEAKYQALCAQRDLTKATRSNYLAFSRHVVRMLGERPLKAVTALDVSEALETMAKEKAGVAKAVLAYMRISFAAAVDAGWIENSPVRLKRIAEKTPVKRARLTLEVFNKVYAAAPTEWLRNAMALALVSAQRREDVARAQFKDFKDGGWWLTQASEKTDHPHRIFIPGELRPAGFNQCLSDVVLACRQTGVLSRHLVHQTVRRGRSSVGGAIRLSTVSRAFSEAVEALGIDWGDKTPPTFHEIRSLSLRLYGDQGVNVQLLAGHSDPDTTAIYLNSRGQEFVKVTV